MQSKGLSRVFSNTTVQKHQLNPKALSVAEKNVSSSVFSLNSKGLHQKVSSDFFSGSSQISFSNCMTINLNCGKVTVYSDDYFCEQCSREELIYFCGGKF